MGYWGWRSLGAGVISAVFVSVWVVGCTLVNSPAATLTYTPVFTPEITLTVGRVGPPAPGVQTTTVMDRSPAPTLMIVDTPIPTAEPTPNLYVIQAGDTLLDVALRYGIALDALRAANPDVTGLLQIGQLIVIPPAPPASADASTPSTGALSEPTPTPLALRVEAPTCYPMPLDRALCLGRVFNTTSAAVTNIGLRWKQGAVERAFTLEQPILAANTFAAYAFFVPRQTDMLGGTPDIELMSADPAGETLFALLDVEDMLSTPHERRMTITAQIANANGEAISQIFVYVVLLDSAERVIGYRVVAVAGRLSPGMRVPFEAELPLLTDGGGSVVWITAIGRTGLS